MSEIQKTQQQMIPLMKALLDANNKAQEQRSTAKIIDDCAVLMQKLVRLKAADHNGFCKCVTCGIVKHWSVMQGAHFIERD